MENIIKYVNINNFKSIAKLKLEDCRRINLFIGYPNVGKSNVLEALSLFSLPYLEEIDFLNRFVRAENKTELFYNVSSQNGEIETNLEKISFTGENSELQVNQHTGSGMITYQFSFKLGLKFVDLNNLNVCTAEEYYPYSDVKKYIFNNKVYYETKGYEYLLPPFGENIIEVLSYNGENIADLKAWMKQEFAKFGLEYVLDKSSNSLKVQRRLGNDEVLQLPYSSIADTLQRIIFYKTAIASNKNSVLLFEEPEAHAFPPYIQTIMQDIIDAESNQFFIVTHSPLVVNAFLEYEKLRKETSIYLFDYKNDQTTAKRLSDEEMELAYEYGDDLFFNLENLL